MGITLAELKLQARRRADMERSKFVKDAELVEYINASIAELVDLLIQAYDSDYYLESYQFNTVSGQNAYDLPDDFYKLRGVDAQINGSDSYALRPFNFNERLRFSGSGSWTLLQGAAVRYRLLGNQIKFTPTPDQATPITLWYIPVIPKLVNDSDEFNDLNQYAEYVVIDAAIKMLNKEESDVSVLAAQKAAIIQRLNSAAQNRDTGASDSVTDIYADNDDYYFWRR